MIHDPNPKILDLIQSLLTMNWMAMESKDCLAFVRQLLKKVELEQVVVVEAAVVVAVAAVETENVKKHLLLLIFAICLLFPPIFIIVYFFPRFS